MEIEIQYMGILAEKTGRTIELFNQSGNLLEIIELVLKKYPALRDLNFVTAHNGSILHGDSEIKSGDRVTLIPPAPGG